MHSRALIFGLALAACGPHIQRREGPRSVDLEAPPPTMASRRDRPGPPPETEPLSRLDEDGDGVVDDAELGPDHERAFMAMDTDGDERLDRDELSGVVLELGSSEEGWLEAWDTDRDGALDVTEFGAGRFDALDRDHDDVVDSQEWQYRYGLPSAAEELAD